MTPSRMTPLMAARTKMDWSPMGVILSSLGTVGCDAGQQILDCPRRLRVEAVPDLRMVRSTPRWPSWRTMLVCGMRAVANGGDVLEVDGGAVDLLERQVATDRRAWRGCC